MTVHFKSKNEVNQCVEVLTKVLKEGTSDLTDDDVADLTTILARLDQGLEEASERGFKN